MLQRGPGRGRHLRDGLHRRRDAEARKENETLVAEGAEARKENEAEGEEGVTAEGASSEEKPAGEKPAEDSKEE